jgi:ribosomal protein L32
MDQLLLVLLVLAAAGAIAAILLSRSRRRTALAGMPPPEARFAVSTEGMKVCPTCGMGNLWTERTCSACGSSLKG